MLNQQLVDYIKQATDHGQSKEQIKQALLIVGWQEKDIEEAFGGSANINVPTPQPMQSAVPFASVQSSGDIQTGSTKIKYAGFWIRWVAGFIDGIITGAIGFVVGVLLAFLLAIFGIGKETISTIVSPLGYILGWGYFIFMTYKYEATLGKKIIGIKVLSDKSEKLTVWQVILRETVGKIASIIILGIGYIMAGFTERKQALHDKIASTTVVYKDPNKKISIWVYIVVAILYVLVIVSILGILASVVLVSLNTAREKARDAKRVADMQIVRLSLDRYFDVNDKYPTQTMAGDLSGVASDLGKLPCDPSISLEKCGFNGSGYVYYSLDGSNYHIGAALENTTSAQLSSDDDSDVGFSGADNNADCGLSTITHGVACYDLEEKTLNQQSNANTISEKKLCGSMSTVHFSGFLFGYADSEFVSAEEKNLWIPTQQEKNSLECMSLAFSECSIASFDLVAPRKEEIPKDFQQTNMATNMANTNFEINKDETNKSCSIKISSLNNASIPTSLCKMPLSIVAELKNNAILQNQFQYMFAPVILMLGMSSGGGSSPIDTRTGKPVDIECK